MNNLSTHIANILHSHRFTLENEKKLQADISQVLAEQEIEHTREVRLSDRDIIDFMIDGIGIEVKIGGSKLDIHRQLTRYCKHDLVKEIVLVTNVAIRLPIHINGRNTRVVNLGRAWL